MGKSKGWIKLDRSVRDSWVWKGEPFSKGQAWIDLLLRAAHEDKTFYWNDHLVKLKRGQLITSLRQLASDWGWGWRRTVRYIEMLKSDEMISADSSTHGTTITIVNWDKFQVLGRTGESTYSTTDDSTGDSTVDRHTRNRKKENNDKRNPRARDPLGQFAISPGMRNDYTDMIAQLERENEERNRRDRLQGGSWEDDEEDY